MKTLLCMNKRSDCLKCAQNSTSNARNDERCPWMVVLFECLLQCSLLRKVELAIMRQQEEIRMVKRNQDDEDREK